MGNVTPLSAARRVVSWANTRWNWKRGVRQDARLTDAAKVLAAALCDDWANHETGFCNPSISTLAESLGKSERSIQRSIAALRDAGWLNTIVRGRGDRGGGRVAQGSEFLFLMAEECPQAEPVERRVHTSEKVTQLSPYRQKGDTQRVTPVTVKGDIRVVPPCTPYKDKPNLNQSARDREAAPSRAMHPISIGGAVAENWEGWLKRHGHPALAALAVRSKYAGEAVWLLPIRSPPVTGDAIEERIVQRWIDEREQSR